MTHTCPKNIFLRISEYMYGITTLLYPAPPHRGGNARVNNVAGLFYWKMGLWPIFPDIVGRC